MGGLKVRLYSQVGLMLLLGLMPMLKASEVNRELWNELKITEFSTREWRTYTWLEARYREGDWQPGVWLAQQKVYRRLSNGWETGMGATYVDVESSSRSWNSQLRIDWELNPRWNLGKESSFQLRNRLEWRSFEKAGETSRLITRHRILFSKQARWFGSMQGVEVSDEVFFDTRLGVLVENRFRPLNLRFSAGDRGSVNVFAQLRSRRVGASHSWNHAAVLGLGWSFR